MTKDEALELALDALETELSIDWTNNDEFNASAEKMYEAIAAIKEALAQPEHDYERGFVDGMQKQMQSSVDKAVNRMAQPEQEPVAWADIQKEAQQIVESKFLWKQFIDRTPLANDIAVWMADFAKQYTASPQRTWVGLTDEQMMDAIYVDDTPMERGRRVEAKLKEKNT
jgi:hypothetical protein